MSAQDQDYQNITCSVTIELAVPADDVFSHLIDLPKWWPEDLIGEGLNDGVGFTLTTGEDHYSKNRVTDFIPGKKLAWITTESIRKSDGFDWTGTKFIFELTPKGKNTLLEFTYDGVVLQHEREKLKQICDICINKMFYEFVLNGRTK